MRNRTENQIKLVLIRHGATKSNQEHRYLGKTDESLSTEGKNELQKAVDEGCYPQANLVFSSSMRRCIETAEILYPGRTPIVISEWEETDFGDFEGKNAMDLQDDTRYQAWIDSGGTLPFPGGESRELFSHRCDIGFHKIMELIPMQTQENLCGNLWDCVIAALIVHGGTIMSLLSRYGGGEYFDYQVPNGGGYLCTVRCMSEGSERFEIRDIKRI